jgi:predicted nucleic acid-binding protein
LLDPALGPFLFDTSAESWIARSANPAVQNWFWAYLRLHRVHVSAITVLERMRGYRLLASRATAEQRTRIEQSREAYLRELGRVWPVDAAVAVVAAELTALLPDPPSPSRRSHRLVESHRERLVRWRYDIMIASTALVSALPLVHNNAADFEAIRSAVEREPWHFPGLGPLNLHSCVRLV